MLSIGTLCGTQAGISGAGVDKRGGFVMKLLVLLIRNKLRNESNNQNTIITYSYYFSFSYFCRGFNNIHTFNSYLQNIRFILKRMI